MNEDTEKAKADEARKALPVQTSKYYVDHYRLDYGHEGEFAGLVCKCCNRWSDRGHDKDCAVGDIESGTVQ